MNILDLINKEIKENDIIIFMKGTKESPCCGFSRTVVDIFNNLNIRFKDINVLDNPEIRQGIKDFTKWPTIPQIFIKGEFIGGCDILKELYRSKELHKIIETKNINGKVDHRSL